MIRLSARRAVLSAAFLAVVAVASSQQTARVHSRVAFSHTLPELNGHSLKAHVVEVTYLPGESSATHTHPCPVIGYVLEGAVRMQVKGEEEAVYRSGETFYEGPNGVHQISANASNTEKAKFLAYFVCDKDTPLSLPVRQKESSGGN